MEKILQQRINFFTKIYFVLFSIGLLVLIYKIDSNDSREDMNYILECDRYDKISLSDINESGTIEDKIYTWLNSSNPSLWNKNKKSRELLVNILTKEYGAPLDDINFLKGYSGESEKHNFNLIGIDSTYKNELIKFQERENEFSTIEECLQKMKLLSKPFYATILNNIDTNNLRLCIDSLYVEPNVYSAEENIDEETGYTLEVSDIRLVVFQRASKVEKVNFKDGHFFVSIKYGGYNPQHGAIPQPDIPIKGIQERVEINSFSALLNTESDFVEELLNNERLFNRINTTYGKLYVDDCIKLLSEENSKSFKSVSIFGFQFSRQRLPFVFLFFFLLAGVGIYLSTLRATNYGLKVISNINEGDALFMLIENKFTRFFIWCVSPVLVVLMNYEYNISSLMTIIITITSLMIIIYLNIRSFFLSFKL